MVVERILEKAAAGADKAEVLLAESETTRVTFKGSELRETGIVNGRGVGLRVFANGRVGFASTTDFDKADDVVAAALATANYGRKAAYDLPDGNGDYADVKTFDDAAAALSPRTMVELGEQAVEMLKSADERLVVTVEIERTVGRTRLANSAGLDRTEDNTGYEFAVVVQRTTEGDILFHYDYDVSVSRDFDEMAVVQRLADSLQWADEIVSVETGKMDVIFDPAEVPTLLLPVVTCVNGAYVADRSSALAGRLDEEVVDPRVTVIDDATDGFGWMAGAFDGEGTPTRRTAVIERGVLKTYLTDLATAAQLGTAPTGHARRSVTSPPQPGVSNVVVDPGESTAARLVADTKSGIIVLHTAGGGMGNIRGGELSAAVAYALKVENGEIVGRVKDCLFAGNVFEMLGPRLRAVSSDARRSHGHYMAPTVVIADQSITAKS
ncbi:MAG TPA: TldD/PmbA family protein [bacterium]|nr:TldD/PmbA family protein [bacterium]